MKKICHSVTSEIEIKKSRFITKLFYVTSLEEVQTIMGDLKKEYKDADHYCYAYIIHDLKKSSDDKEPGGTAGVPMMEVLSQYDLNLVLCVVIRYFGGIKLGAGGLVRAYRKAVLEALSVSEMKELEKGYLILLETEFQKENTLLGQIGKERILEKKYGDYLQIMAKVPLPLYETLSSQYSRIQILERIWL